MWTDIPVPVPGGVDKRVHCVSFTFSGTAALRTSRITKAGVILERRFSSRSEVDIVGQDDRQVLFRYGNGSTLLAVENGNRRAPETLPANQPVTHPVTDCRTTGVDLFQLPCNCFCPVATRETAERSGV